MRPIGYLFKRVVARPEWLKAQNVEDIYSLSGHISEDFADYINYWKHNGFWLFDSPSIMQSMALEHGISLDGLKLFYYEAHELQPFGARSVPNHRGLFSRRRISRDHRNAWVGAAIDFSAD